MADGWAEADPAPQERGDRPPRIPLKAIEK